MTGSRKNRKSILRRACLALLIGLATWLPLLVPSPAQAACGGLNQRPCVSFEGDRPCMLGLSEDYERNRCLPFSRTRSAFKHGFNSFANLVAKGSDLCRKVHNMLPQPPVPDSGVGRLIGEQLVCRRQMIAGFRCAAPLVLKKVAGAEQLMKQFEQAFNSGQCRAPLRFTAARARYHGRLGCPAGTKHNRSTGLCYSCPPGYKRTVANVRGPKACTQRRLVGPWTYARFHGRPRACPPGSKRHLLTKQCWSCPSGFVRSITSIRSPSACVRATGTGPFRAHCAALTVVNQSAVQPTRCLLAMIGNGSVRQIAADPRVRAGVCYAMGEAAFDMALSRALGNPDLTGNVRRFARALRVALTASGVKRRSDQFIAEMRNNPACRGVF